VTNLGQGAFQVCIRLAAVTFSSGLASIGESAFAGCSSLAGLTLPATVASIRNSAFSGCSSLTSLTIPASITNLGSSAFANCAGLVNIYFKGNAPAPDPTVFASDPNATVYYLPDATGWTSTCGGAPALLWNPMIETADASFGVLNNQFGFNITGTANIPIVVQAADNLANPVWTSLQSLTLTNGSFYFSEPFHPASPTRFYRITSQ